MMMLFYDALAESMALILLGSGSIFAEDASSVSMQE